MPDDYAPTEEVILIRHAGLRMISKTEVASVLSQKALRRSPENVLVDTMAYADDVDGGVWDASERYIIEEAKRLRALADENGASRFLYFGLAEIPHAIALGAYLGDERHVDVFDHHRDEGTWAWPSEEKSIKVSRTTTLTDTVTMPGDAAVRVEVSAAISDDDVEAAIGPERIADVTIRVENKAPEVATVIQSSADVQAIRQEFRSALAALSEKRPNMERIHLFVAAPTPVCFALGQELHLRNSVPVQTYRFRKREDAPNYQAAIELTAEEAQASDIQLSNEEVREAKRVREEVWPEALREVHRYAQSKKDMADGREQAPWHQSLRLREHLQGPNPFPQLPPIWEVVDFDDGVDPEPYPGNEYGRDATRNLWRLSDPLLVSLSHACEDDDELKQLIRLFLFHEYLHTHHSLTKYTAEGVGRFANCLERLDYEADFYALLHQLDWAAMYGDIRGGEHAFLQEQLDLLLRSAWAFVPGETVKRWQVRRVRRLLNWYWRQVQVQEAPDIAVALDVLSKAPSVELVGQQLRTGAGRTYMMMTKLDPAVELSLGLITEDERLLRIVDQVNHNLKKLMEAFRCRQHEEIKIFFAGVFERAKQMGSALPS
jgi:hypothetical protein